MSIKESLLTAPDGHLDASMFPLIEKWDEPPTSLQVMEVLDNCIGFALASPFVMQVLNILLEDALAAEGTTREAVWAQANELWRKTMYED